MQHSATFPAAIALIAVLSGAQSPAAGQPAAADAITPAALAGTWKGTRCESAPWSRISRRRQFAFTGGSWKI